MLIIGGGMAGILCAWFMEQSGIDYCLVEANTICSGITADTTAKITSQHGLIYQKLIKEFGVELAACYLKINELAVAQYRMMCRSIACNFEDKDDYVYAIDSAKKLEKEMDALVKIGYEAEYISEVNLPFQTMGAVKFPHQAQFHPLKFVAEISKNLKIFEHTKVTEMGVQTAKTESGIIHAKKIIVATHFPMINKQGMYFLKIYQSRSYVLALENAQQVDGMYVDANKNGLSFRNYSDLLLLGGGGHKTGKMGGGWKELSEFAKRYYPDARERLRFATQDCMTLDDVPYIGQYGKNTEGLYVTTGFNKWGMTTSME